MWIPRKLESEHNSERTKKMNHTTTPRGLTQNEYNALLHAIWRINRMIVSEDLDNLEIAILRRDKDALEGLFQRL